MVNDESYFKFAMGKMPIVIFTFKTMLNNDELW